MTENLQHKIENIISRNPQADDRKIIYQLKQLIYETEFQHYADEDAKNIIDLVAENLYRLGGEMYSKSVVKTGFNRFDTALGGFLLGEFVVIGARPSVGKTQFLVNLSLNISLTVPVLYVTLDLSDFSLTQRFMACVSGIAVHNILRHGINEEQTHRLSGELAKRRLFIYSRSNGAVDELRAYCQKQIRENGIKVIVVDYLQLLATYNQRKYNRDFELSYICRELKNMAKENNICIIASSQLSRAVESRNEPSPQLSDLRESGAIEQDADMVLFLHRPDYPRLNDFEKLNAVSLTVAKNRNGILDTFELLRDDNFTRFQDAENKFTFSTNRLNELGISGAKLYINNDFLEEPPF